MPSELHEQLCEKGVSWLKRNGFAVAAMNVWPSEERSTGSDWELFVHTPCVVAERSILYTISRKAVGN